MALTPARAAPGEGTPLIAFTQNSRSEVREIGGDGQIVGAVAADVGAQQQNYLAFQSSQSGMRVGDQHPTLDGNNGSRRHHGAIAGMTVRRLTPTECERLQGFPDDWTAITYRGKPAADGPRYRALGNAMAVPCVGWILERIGRFEKLRA